MSPNWINTLSPSQNPVFIAFQWKKIINRTLIPNRWSDRYFHNVIVEKCGNVGVSDPLDEIGSPGVEIHFQLFGFTKLRIKWDFPVVKSDRFSLSAEYSCQRIVNHRLELKTQLTSNPFHPILIFLLNVRGTLATRVIVIAIALEWQRPFVQLLGNIINIANGSIQRPSC